MITSDVESLGALAVIGVVVAAFARSRGLSIALPLIGVGVLVSILPWGPSAPAAPELVLIAVLAPLVFGEALSTSYLDIRKVSKPVLLLAVGLVVVSAFAVGAAVALVVPTMPFAAALCLGAVLGPTDAVSVSAVARKAGLPRRVVNILEGESLVNDGTALTLLRVAVVAAVAGGLTVREVTVAALESVLGGLGVGAAAGLLLVLVLRRLDDTVAGNGIVLVAPFPVYVGAERLEGSGILAVVVAGLVVAHGTSSDPQFRGRLQVGAVWRQITFVLQAVAFTLVGTELPDTLRRLDTDELRQAAVLVPLVAVVLAVSRGVFVLGLLGASRASGRHTATGWQAWLVIAWAGARGPISGLAAFSLPLVTATGAPFPDRDLILAVTMSVIVVTLLLAPTLGPVARALRLPPEDDRALLRRVRLALARASLDRLEEVATEAERVGTPLPESAVGRLREAAVKRLDVASALVDGETPAVAPEVPRRLAQQMIRAEMEELVRLRDEEGLSDAVMRTLLADLELRSGALRRS